MQRATGQYDHLARVPRTGPCQSRDRRSFAPRHRCRAAPRRSRGMEPTVRNPRIESAIGLEAARSSHLSRRESGIRQPELDQAADGIVKTTGDGMLVEFASAVEAVTCAMQFNCGLASRPTTAAGNGIFGCGDRPPNIAAKMGERSQRPKSGK